MEWKNELTRLLHLDYPIIQAPMFGVTTPEMVAAASNSNCLGSLALGDLNAEKSIERIRTTKKLTDKPFAVNFFTHTIPEITDTLRADYTKAKLFVDQLAKKHHLEVNTPELDTFKLNSYHEQVEAILSENCKIVSFTFGNLDAQSIAKFKNNGTLLIGTCTTVHEALLLEQSGIDIICVQGWEAGGHRATFTSETLPKIGGLSLLSQVRDTIKTPIIYAGGIYNAKTLLASKTLGANGFQIGSLLVASKESNLQDFEKERLKSLKEDDIIMTNSFSGRYARGIKNSFMTEMEQSGHILPYPYQNKLTAELRRIAKVHQNTEFVTIWVGQSIGAFSTASTAAILSQLIEETENYTY